MWPLFVAGAALQVVGQWQASQAQAAAEKANADFYDAQKEFAAAAGRREKKIFEEETAFKHGQQIGAFAANGIELTGNSALAFMANQGANALDELNAIEYKTRMDVMLAGGRATQARETARSISGAAPYQAAGTVLTGAATYYSTEAYRNRGS